ncbi:MAG: hypothetical protein Q8P59_13865 [Dehalococcoidia bacterium]|nr:hypothetical protein [Dehalococcoidia bacterium]
MPLRPVLRLLLAGLVAGTAFLAPWLGGDSRTPHSSVGHQPPSYAPDFSLGYTVAHADGPGDWPMFRHDPAQRLVLCFKLRNEVNND